MKFLTIVALLAFAPIAYSQCSNGRCSTATRFVQPDDVADGFTWLKSSSEPGTFYLFRGTNHVGTFDGSAYRRIVQQGAWPVESPPIAIPAKQMPSSTSPALPAKEKKLLGPAVIGETLQVFAEDPVPEKGPEPRELPPGLEPWQTDGVEASKIEGPHYTLNGKQVSKDRAFYSMVGGNLVDDRNKYFVVAVGDRKFGEDFQKVWSQVPVNVRESVHMQVYDQNNYAVAARGLQPGVSYMPPPDSKGQSPVIWRFPDMPAIGELTDAIVKPDPNYDPKKDPNPRNQPVPSPATGNGINGTTILAGGALAALGIFLWRTAKK